MFWWGLSREAVRVGILSIRDEQMETQRVWMNCWLARLVQDQDPGLLIFKATYKLSALSCSLFPRGLREHKQLPTGNMLHLPHRHGVPEPNSMETEHRGCVRVSPLDPLQSSLDCVGSLLFRLHRTLQLSFTILVTTGIDWILKTIYHTPIRF